MNIEEIVKHIENCKKVNEQGGTDKMTIAELRKSLQITQKEFARILGVERTTLARYEVGIIKIRFSLEQIKVIQILLDLCGLEWHDLKDDLSKEDG